MTALPVRIKNQVAVPYLPTQGILLEETSKVLSMIISLNLKTDIIILKETAGISNQHSESWAMSYVGQCYTEYVV